MSVANSGLAYITGRDAQRAKIAREVDAGAVQYINERAKEREMDRCDMMTEAEKDKHIEHIANRGNLANKAWEPCKEIRVAEGDSLFRRNLTGFAGTPPPPEDRIPFQSHTPCDLNALLKPVNTRPATEADFGIKPAPNKNKKRF